MQRQHVAMAVDDPRLGRVKRGDAEQRGLHPHRIGGIEHGHVLDAVLERLGVDRLELGNIGVLGDDEQLAELAMGNAVRGAIGVKQTARARTLQGLLAAGRIVEPGVNDLAVARRRAGADAGSSLRHDDVVAAQRRLARDRKPHHPSADHQNLHRRPLLDHLDAVAGRDAPGRDHLGIDAAIGVIEALHERMRDRQVADAGAGLDLGRGAAADALDDLEPRLRSDREGAAHELELVPRRPSLDMEIAAKAQRIDRRADDRLDGSDRSEIDDGYDLLRHVGEAVPRRVQDLRRPAQLVGAELGEE